MKWIKKKEKEKSQIQYKSLTPFLIPHFNLS